MNERRRELKAQYRERKIVGGVFAIRNTATGRLLLDAAVDLQAGRNRFLFARQTDTCVDVALRGDWARYGAGAFAFEVLEELEKKEAQSDAEFAADIRVLHEMWREKLGDRELY